MGHINGTGNKAQGRDETAKGKDVGEVGKAKLTAPKAKTKKGQIPAAQIVGKIKGLK